MGIGKPRLSLFLNRRRRAAAVCSELFGVCWFVQEPNNLECPQSHITTCRTGCTATMRRARRRLEVGPLCRQQGPTWSQIRALAETDSKGESVHEEKFGSISNGGGQLRIVAESSREEPANGIRHLESPVCAAVLDDVCQCR